MCGGGGKYTTTTPYGKVKYDDKGKVIGRQGRVAKSMRTLLRVTAVKENVRVNLEIL